MRGCTLSAKMSDSKPARAQVLLDGQRLVADGVAVGERRQELVDAARHAALAGAAARERGSRYFRSITSQA